MIEENTPHKAVVLIRADIHQLCDTGECKPLQNKTISELLVFSGNRVNTEEKVKNFIQKIKEIYNEQENQQH